MSSYNEVVQPEQGCRAQKPRNGGGGKLKRVKIIQARLDPQMFDAAHEMARTQRRTLSSFIEQLIVAEFVKQNTVNSDIFSDSKNLESTTN